ncbi:potassium channel subfamily K member 2-like [Daphnia pulicaria]|uniref:potassium channel subfamily K member 2-like n=1 Tax=Daphnia pulicaria TaxID=35523 RepID=UPI001EEB5D70|nr:potassium channel subfamily K member 2-like [Daphnia pulicaria]
MGWKSSLTIHVGFWFYLVAGGLVYYYIENPMYHLPPVEKPMTINISFCQHLMNSVEYSASVSRGGANYENDHFEIWFGVVRESCNNLTVKLENVTDVNDTGDVAWEFSSALFLCMNILTTIGYGNFSPKSDWGKIFCIFYGFVGIPICVVFLASTSDYFSNMFLYLYERRQNKKKNDDKRQSIFIAAIFFLIPGLAVFIFFPSAIFVFIEGWSYLDATYFSFLTLTSVGFGDIVAAQQTNGKLLWLYRISWIIWVTLGIAYWAIVINFITKALKSKNVREKWEKTSHALAVQAKEVRRVVRSFSNNTLQLSHSGQNSSNEFIALKSKTVFDFAHHFTDSMGKALTNPERKRSSLTDFVTAFQSGSGLVLQQQQSVVNYNPDVTESIPRWELGGRRQSEQSPVSAKDIIDTYTQNDGSYPWLSFGNAQTGSANADDNVSLPSVYLSANPSRKTSETKNDFPSRWYDDDASIRSTYLSLNPSRKTSETNNDHPNMSQTSIENPPLRNLLIEALMILNEAETNGTVLDQ